MPPEARSKLLDMLCQSGVESPEWWWDVLVGEGGPPYRELESILSPSRHKDNPICTESGVMLGPVSLDRMGRCQ